MKVVIDHTAEDLRDMFYLDHARCEELENFTITVLKKLIYEDDFFEANALEELAIACNDIQEYTYVMRQFYMSLERMEAVEKNPIGSLFGLLLGNLNRGEL